MKFFPFLQKKNLIFFYQLQENLTVILKFYFFNYYILLSLRQDKKFV